jgi:hypothetical protein
MVLIFCATASDLFPDSLLPSATVLDVGWAQNGAQSQGSWNHLSHQSSASLQMMRGTRGSSASRRGREFVRAGWVEGLGGKRGRRTGNRNRNQHRHQNRKHPPFAKPAKDGAPAKSKASNPRRTSARSLSAIVCAVVRAFADQARLGHPQRLGQESQEWSSGIIRVGIP